MKIKAILNLIRIRQYYKNVLIFVGAFFGGYILDFSMYPILIFGFILLCCASSINYIINDLKDIEKDKKHPEKLKKKAIASGEVSITLAVSILILLIIIIAVSMFIIQNFNFIIMILLVIATGQLYNHVFKDHAFVDIIVLSLVYLWRALSGCFLIEVYISPWLILAIFDVALFLVIAKRKGDLLYLGEEKAKEHKKSYDQYSIKLLEQFHIVVAASIFITFELYLIFRFNLFSEELIFLYQYLIILSGPIMLYIIMRYMYLTSAKPEIARNTEKAFFDKGLIIAGMLIGGIFVFTFYYQDIIELILNFFNLNSP